MLARLLIALGEHDGARSLLEQARVEIDAGALTEWSAAPAACLGRLHFDAGRLDAAEKEARAANALANELGTGFVVPLARATLASVALARDRTAAAARAVALCRSLPAPTGMEFATARWTMLAGQIATVLYGSERAVAVLAPIYGVPGRHKRLLLEEPAAGADLVRCALAAGDQRAARAVVSCTDQLAADNQTFRAVVAGADHARGLLDRDVALLERAAATHVSPLAQAAAMADLGMELVAEDEHDAGCARLERAIAMFECLGATRDGERTRSRLREASRRGRGGRRSGPASASSALTPAERAVAQFAVKGLTNRQIGEQMFLSRHTIDFHLRHVYRKLEVKSRVHLTRLVLDRPSALYAN
jgi:DNA-binding CsgD family transcriptional regulator